MKKIPHALPDPEDVESPPLLTHEERLKGLKLMLLRFGIKPLPFPADTRDAQQLGRNIEHIWAHGGSGGKQWGLVTMYVIYRESLFAIEGDAPEKPE